MSDSTTPFDLLGPLPTGTTVLEASAGTGKTYAVGALVARYVAEGEAVLDEMLVITFGRAASQELRQRVRESLVDAERALADPESARARNDVVGLLSRADDAEVARRRRRLTDALAGFDAATIATTHQFCHLVLASLGVAGDTDADARLVEDLDDLVVEVVDDLYLATYGAQEQRPPFDREAALALARAAVGDPQARLAPADSDRPMARERYRFAGAVRRELDRRKRRLGILSYDDLLSRLADALEDGDSPARQRMRQRWKVVLVDEFQDTDPVQWSVLDRAFRGHATLVLVGDPKQAIYAFRGGDVAAYLDAVAAGDVRHTLATNWRSDAPLVDALQALLRDVELGDPRITVPAVAAAPELAKARLRGAPVSDPVRLRAVPGGGQLLPIAACRRLIADDLAADVARLLTSGATWDGRPVGAGDVAVLSYSLKHAQLFREALHRRGIPTVIGSAGSVLLSDAAGHWLTLLEALEQPHQPRRVRAVGLTPFVGLTPQQVADGGDELTDELAERVRGWLDVLRARGIAAVHESIVAGGLAERVLATSGGERLLTDIEHLAELLHDQAHRERRGPVALLEWLRAERRSAGRGDTRSRRLDTDARAVQFLTIHASKGLQFPVVYLPLAFNRWVNDRELTALYHDDAGVRTLDVSGSGSPAADAEAAGEELRLAYVALTRAQSQVVAWVAPTRDSANGGLSRLVLGRTPEQTTVPQHAPVPDDDRVRSVLTAWADHGALRVEEAVPAGSRAELPAEPAGRLEVRQLTRTIDTAWRRTSYSALIRADEQQSAQASEPELEGTVDEPDLDADGVPPAVAAASDDDVDLPSPMADLPAGATFGSLVHGVLEHADPQAPDLLAELRGCVAEQQRWWSVDAGTDEIAEALLPMHQTPLGPLAGDLTLAQIGRSDRLCELDFEFPLAGGDDPAPVDVRLAEVGRLLRDRLSDDDPLRPYADRLTAPGFGDQLLRGYLSGSIDVVLRVPGDQGHRYVVVDYKTNLLGEPGRPVTALDYTPARMTAAMLHSHYPLQALLYSVVLHRFLRWRLPDYDPGRHLGGVLYLYVRGMCGPGTPIIDGQPCGAFAWQQPPGLVEDLSDLLAGRMVSS